MKHLVDASKFLHSSDDQTDTYLVPVDQFVRVVAVPHGTPLSLGRAPWAAGPRAVAA
jgi:hypothetical protein